MAMTSYRVALVAPLAIVPDGVGIAAALTSSISTDETTHGALSSSASASSLTSSEWLKQQQQHDASAAGQAPQLDQTRFLQLQDETTGEVQDGSSSSSSSSSSTICITCSFPLSYTFQLAFKKNENCYTSTLEGTESYLLSGVECLMTPSETPPMYISSIHFLEFDSTAYLNVIHENTTYFNGPFYNDEVFTFPSSIALAEGDEYTLPGAAGLFIFGNDEDSGEPILKNQVVWTFGTPGVGDSKDCKKAARELEGKSLGWVVFEEVVSTDHEFCIEASTSPPSSSSSMSDSVIVGSASSSSPTLAPTAATIININSSSPVGIEVGGSKSSKSGNKSKSTSSKQSSMTEEVTSDYESGSLSKTAKSGGGEDGDFDGQTTRKGGTTSHR